MNRDQLSAALGKVPSGLYIATAWHGKQPVGMLVSFVEQTSFEPPMVSMALGPDRLLANILRQGGAVGLNLLGKANGALMKPFFKEGGEPFREVDADLESGGPPRLKEALAFLEGRYHNSMPAGDHELFVLEVVNGILTNQTDEPMIRIRRDGFAY